MPEDKKLQWKHHSNIIPFPKEKRARIEVWRVIYATQSNDGWIRRTLVVRD